jgi:hypothetical protein
MLKLIPDLATSDMIKGWGRWESDCYSRYTRLKLPQKESIFGQISGALQSTLPPTAVQFTRQYIGPYYSHKFKVNLSMLHR